MEFPEFFFLVQCFLLTNIHLSLYMNIFALDTLFFGTLPMWMINYIADLQGCRNILPILVITCFTNSAMIISWGVTLVLLPPRLLDVNAEKIWHKHWWREAFITEEGNRSAPSFDLCGPGLVGLMDISCNTLWFTDFMNSLSLLLKTAVMWYHHHFAVIVRFFWRCVQHYCFAVNE